MSSTTSDIYIRKTLSWLLRHAALEGGIVLSSDGFASVSHILNHKRLRRGCTLADVKRIVKSNDKQRFALRVRDGVLEIRANKGHSLKGVEDLELFSITDSSCVPYVIHGTYLSNLLKIQEIGLSRMTRNHIHFASDLPSIKSVISGIRRDAQVFIYIDLARALKDGLKFYRSSNGVILSPGNEQGLLEPKYFLKIDHA